MDATKQIGPEREYNTSNLEGMYFALYGDHEQPVMIDFDGCKVVPLFDTELSLHGVMKHIGVSDYRIARVGDGPGFVGAVMENGYHCAFNVHVAPLNPHVSIAPIRYTLVKLYPQSLQ